MAQMAGLPTRTMMNKGGRAGKAAGRGTSALERGVMRSPNGERAAVAEGEVARS